MALCYDDGARDARKPFGVGIKMEKPNCYECKHRGELNWDAHSMCKRNPVPNVKGAAHGIKKGWFNFPFNFDPVWLENCDGFEKIENHSE